MGLDDFDDWEPSQHVRIKLIAPSFPRRVLATVKWLGDLYGMRIEAIRARLFDVDGELQCSFERVLPLPGAEEFDLTAREREKRKRDENTSRRPDVINFLIASELLSHGAKLWILPSALPEEIASCGLPTIRAFNSSSKRPTRTIPSSSGGLSQASRRRSAHQALLIT